jgi:GNAT superfamily N-acetyltransferase
MLTLRSFRDEDSAQVRALYERATLATAGHGPWEDDLAAISTTYISPGGCFVVVQEESSIIAMGALRLHGTHEAEVKRMRVDPSKQRRGLGQMVLDGLLRHATKARVRRVFLDTDDQWSSARRFYEKNGFVEYQRKHWQGTTLVLYERTLGDGRP